MIKLQPEEQKSFSEYVYSLCAIQLDDSKGYLIEHRLASLVEEAGCDSYRGLLQRAKSDRSRLLERRIVDAITTNETSFFRDTAPFELLRHKLIPELIDRRTRGGKTGIRIWSAACSTGQELYSMAIVLKELLGTPERYGVQLLGTDISDDAVARASAGLFSAVEMSRGLTDAQRDRYFVAQPGGWRIRDEIRALACFQKMNLMEDLSCVGRFDIIFCRNVAIYFNERDRTSLFRRISSALEPGGALLVGAMESLNSAALSGAGGKFEAQRYLRAVFYRLKA